MKNLIMNQTEKDKIFDRANSRAIFLDGEPAIIRGRLLDFPVVTGLKTNTKYEFSWQAVERIINDNGCFRS